MLILQVSTYPSAGQISSSSREFGIAGHCDTLEGHGCQLAPDDVVERWFKSPP